MQFKAFVQTEVYVAGWAENEKMSNFEFCEMSVGTAAVSRLGERRGESTSAQHRGRLHTD